MKKIKQIVIVNPRCINQRKVNKLIVQCVCGHWVSVETKRKRRCKCGTRVYCTYNGRYYTPWASVPNRRMKDIKYAAPEIQFTGAF